MKLKSGMQAPDIIYHDYLNTPFQLSALKGQKVLLSFYRYAGCPFCQLRFSELVDTYGQEDKIKLVAVFQSPSDSIMKNDLNQEVPVTVISDVAERFYKVYGVDSGARAWFVGLGSAFRFLKSINAGNRLGKREGEQNRIPADFLIDEEGILRHVYYGRNMDDHMPVKWVDNFINL